MSLFWNNCHVKVSSGNAQAIPDAFRCVAQTAIEAVAPGGIVVQVGMGKDRASFPVLDVVFKELDFRGCFRYTNTVRPD